MKIVRFTILEARHILDALREAEITDEEFKDTDTIREAVELVTAAVEGAEDEQIPER